MSSDHGAHHLHVHRHDHAHAPADFSRAFAVGILLNAGFVVVEASYGWISGSMALVADAGHNLADVMALVIAWGASALARTKPTRSFTWGLRSSSIMAALINAVLLLLAVALIAIGAVNRLFAPHIVEGETVILVAAIGIVINLATALMFMRGQKHDLNIRGAFLHMAGDAAISAGVVVSGFLLLWTGKLWIDPLVSLLIAAIITASSWGLLRDSVRMSLHATPAHIDAEAIEAWFASLPQITGVHDLHIWPISTTETALTAHLRFAGAFPGNGFMADAVDVLHHRFGIGHATLQLEQDDGSLCALAPDHVV